MEFADARPGHSADVVYSDAIRAIARSTPEKLAIRCDGQDLSFGRLIERIDRFSTVIEEHFGLAPGERIVLIARNRIEYVEVVCGASNAGCAVATIGPASSGSEIRLVCEDTQARLIVCDADLEELAHTSAPPGVSTVLALGDSYEALLAQARARPSARRVQERNTFCIPYTSGSTGRPKGVLLSHRGRVLTSACIAADHGCYTPLDRSLVVTPLFHGAGMLAMMTPLMFGASVELMHRFDIEELVRRIAGFRATSAYLIPTHFAALDSLSASARSLDLSSLKVLMSGTAPLKGDVLGSIEAIFGENRLFQRYGSTEASIIACLRPADMRRKRGAAGRPLPLVHVQVRRPDGSAAPAGEIGPIAVASPLMFSGYLNLPDRTAEAMDGDWFVSGDLGRLDDEGFLSVVDRRHDMIISGGENIYPGEVEQVIMGLEGVRECCVVGVPHKYWGEAVTAFVVAGEGAKLDPGTVRRACQSAMSRYKAPKDIHFIAALPRNQIGKVARDALIRLANKDKEDNSA